MGLRSADDTGTLTPHTVSALYDVLRAAEQVLRGELGGNDKPPATRTVSARDLAALRKAVARCQGEGY